MIKNINKYSVILMTVTREEIESFDHRNQLSFLEMAKENAKDYKAKINLLITGYDEDERELWEIKDVRDYFDFLDRCFPYWFYFLCLPPLGAFQVLVTLVVPIEEILHSNKEGKIVQLDMDCLSKFMNNHLYYLNELADELQIPEKELKEISNNAVAAILG